MSSASTVIDSRHLAHRPRLERAPQWRMRRLGVRDLGDVAGTGLGEMLEQRREEAGRAARARDFSSPRTRTHASMNGPASHGHRALVVGAVRSRSPPGIAIQSP